MRLLTVLLMGTLTASPALAEGVMRPMTGCTPSPESRGLLNFTNWLQGKRKGISPPERGDLVLISITTRDSDQDCVWRVIGLPGDDVSVRDGVVMINGRPLRRRPVEEVRVTTASGDKRILKLAAESDGEREWPTVDYALPTLQDLQPVTVPSGQVLTIEDVRTSGESAIRLVRLSDVSSAIATSR